jgi:hypothetical protein
VGQDLPSIISVEVIGHGGGDGDAVNRNGAPQNDQNDQRRRKPAQQSYNPDSAFTVLGAGDLTEEQKQALTDTERRNLTEP